MKLVEFYPEKQGRPESKVVLDMNSRSPSISLGNITSIVNSILEEAMKKELEEIISKLAETVIELREVKLHLASLSDAHVEAGDGEE